MSLRLRIVLAMTAFVVAGLVIAGSVTYVALRAFLVRRVDQQLEAAQGPVVNALVSGGVPSFGGPGTSEPEPAPLVPPGTFGEYLQGGRVIGSPVTFDYGQERNPPPAVPSSVDPPAQGSTFTTGSLGDAGYRYRVLAQPAGDGVLVVAIPLREVGQTLRRLVGIEALVAAGIVAGLGALSWWTVRRELRPLERIGDTAGAIAAGDLSRRVDVEDPHTEVGRLGIALNAMLAQIERAFAERTASEARLRRFLADASHELRTPLTSIRGYAELFRRGAHERPGDLATSMRRIEDEAARMGILVDDLLRLSRLDQGRPPAREPVDLAKIARDAVADARVVDPARPISLEGPDRLELTGDDARLREVAANLVANALTHTPAGSPVAVRVGSDEDEAFLEVADHGPGVGEADRERVFEPFYRGDPSRGRATGGAGLGLSIVAAIVQAQGGRAEAGTEPGGGARFRVSLPLVTVPQSEREAVLPAPPLGG